MTDIDPMDSAIEYVANDDAEASGPATREQDDEDAQSQTVADDALSGLADQYGSRDSESIPSGNVAQIAPDDTQDIVDHMNQMERSGVIDYDAFRGERNDDDESSTFGNLEDDDRTAKLSDE